jgi:hypothetical protein
MNSLFSARESPSLGRGKRLKIDEVSGATSEAGVARDETGASWAAFKFGGEGRKWSGKGKGRKDSISCSRIKRR